MLKEIQDFYKKNRHAIIWTAGYILTCFLILRILFGFNIFNLYQWSILFHAKLTGFAGFVFGILLLAAIPLYIATTTIIVRTNKPLFDFLPKKEEKKSNTPKDTDKTPEPEIIALPDSIPTELRGAFLRARATVGLHQSQSVFNSPNTRSDKENCDLPPVPDPDTIGELPMPDDFSFDTPSENNTTAPIFREISFDEPTPAPTPTPEDIITRDGLAIISHDDPDFWIADDIDWFANGQQKESPIARVIKFAADNNLQPAIHLITKNIMDLDSKIQIWESLGIKVIVD
jgi:hypothetical protein